MLLTPISVFQLRGLCPHRPLTFVSVCEDTDRGKGHKEIRSQYNIIYKGIRANGETSKAQNSPFKNL